MGRLKDYSGKFRPDLRLQDFSNDTLVRAWETTSRLYILLDGCWVGLVKERFGEQAALEGESEIWRRVAPVDLRWMAEVFNIHGDDVATVFKALQIAPLVGVIYPTQFELSNRNHGVFTIPKCRTLEYFERHNQTEMIKLICEKDGVDHREYQKVAHTYNPKIKCTPLKLPPRKSKDEIACQWEFKLER